MKTVLPANLTMRSVALAFLATGSLLFATGCHRSPTTDAAVRLSGNIEAVDAQVGFKVPGRVASRLVSEGERVAAGQPVALLDDVESRRRPSPFAAPSSPPPRPPSPTSSPARVPRRSHGEGRAAQRRGRPRPCAPRARPPAGAPQQGRHRRPRSRDRRGRLRRRRRARADQAAEALKLAEEGPRRDAVTAARARVESARAALALAETQLENTRLAAPFAGVVLSHNIEPGEFVAAGTPVVTVADLAHVWVRAYVSQTDLGRLRHGQPAEVRTDTFPGKVYQGTVGFISSEAEFTPKTVQTEKERVKLVFRIKVDLANPQDELKPGMPADVTLR
jgi:HlyD family secretion protein